MKVLSIFGQHPLTSIGSCSIRFRERPFSNLWSWRCCLQKNSCVCRPPSQSIKFVKMQKLPTKKLLPKICMLFGHRWSDRNCTQPHEIPAWYYRQWQCYVRCNKSNWTSLYVYIRIKKISYVIKANELHYVWLQNEKTQLNEGLNHYEPRLQ